MFVAFEGGEGAGKSTQETLLSQSLADLGLEIVRTREPGGTPAAEQIRHVLLSRDNTGLDPRAEALLFAASRGDHVTRVIRPALERGAIVVCDRFIDSSVAYQGYGRALGPERVRDLSMWATGGLVPDLTIVLDVDPEVGLSRVANPDRMESEPLEWHRAVRAGFLEIASMHRERYLVLDASLPVAVLADRILQRVESMLAPS